MENTSDTMLVIFIVSIWVVLNLWAFNKASKENEEKRKKKNQPVSRQNARPSQADLAVQLARQQERERRQRQAMQAEIERLRREKRKQQSQRKIDYFAECDCGECGEEHECEGCGEY